MSKLRDAINKLAADLAEGVLEAIRNVSLEDLLAEATPPSSGRGGRGKRRPGVPAAEAAAAPRKAKRNRRLARRTPGDITKVVDRVVALLAQHPKGLRSEEIQSKLGLIAKELPRPLADALAARRISKEGQKRSTRYFAGKVVSKPAPRAAVVKRARVAKAPSKAPKPAAKLAAAKARPAAPAKKVAARKAPPDQRNKVKAKAKAKSAVNGAHGAPPPSVPS